MSTKIFCAVAECRKARNALACTGCALFLVTATGFSMRIVESGTV